MIHSSVEHNILLSLLRSYRWNQELTLLSRAWEWNDDLHDFHYCIDYHYFHYIHDFHDLHDLHDFHDSHDFYDFHSLNRTTWLRQNVRKIIWDIRLTINWSLFVSSKTCGIYKCCSTLSDKLSLVSNPLRKHTFLIFVLK